MKFRTPILLDAALLVLLPPFAPSRLAMSEAQQPASQAPDSTGDHTDHSSAAIGSAAGLRAAARHGRQISAHQYNRANQTYLGNRPQRSRTPTVITPTQILVHGRAPGEVSLIIWDELERSRSFDLRVDVDVSACAEEEHRVFPDEQISVTPSRAAIVLSGHVTTEDVAKRAGELAAGIFEECGERSDLRPRRRSGSFAGSEICRGRPLRPHSTGGQLLFDGRREHDWDRHHRPIRRFRLPIDQSNSRTEPPISATQTISQVLNLFLFRPDIHFGAVIEALENKSLLQILAEPNLIAVNGKKASFLAGGQFPFPIVQPGAGFTAVTISFKEFGVKLEFTAGDHAQRQHSSHRMPRRSAPSILPTR